MKTRAFNATEDEVRQILTEPEGVLWRPWKKQPTTEYVGTQNTLGYPASEGKLWVGFGNPKDPIFTCCPYQPGDALYVRETFRWERGGYVPSLIYCADAAEWVPEFEELDKVSHDWQNPKRRSSATMPRLLSRIDLEVTAVQAELRDEVWHWLFTYRRTKP